MLSITLVKQKNHESEKIVRIDNKDQERLKDKKKIQKLKTSNEQGKYAMLDNILQYIKNNLNPKKLHIFNFMLTLESHISIQGRF